MVFHKTTAGFFFCGRSSYIGAMFEVSDRCWRGFRVWIYGVDMSHAWFLNCLWDNRDVQEVLMSNVYPITWRYFKIALFILEFDARWEFVIYRYCWYCAFNNHDTSEVRFVICGGGFLSRYQEEYSTDGCFVSRDVTTRNPCPSKNLPPKVAPIFAK